jgi:hypothetical protein
MSGADERALLYLSRPPDTTIPLSSVADGQRQRKTLPRTGETRFSLPGGARGVEEEAQSAKLHRHIARRILALHEQRNPRRRAGKQ